MPFKKWNPTQTSNQAKSSADLVDSNFRQLKYALDTWFYGTVNVRDFGAKGDGIADDYVAIQQALTEAGGLKGIYFPAGTYLSSQKISTSGVSVALFGDGPKLTKIAFTTSNAGVELNLTPQGTNQPPDQVRISDLSIEARASTSNPGLAILYTSYQANSQGSVWVRDINITSESTNTYAFDIGLKLKYAVEPLIDSVTILGELTKTVSKGIVVETCIGPKITKCEVTYYGLGLESTSPTIDYSEGIIIDNCFFFHVYNGININDGLHIIISNTHVAVSGTSADCAIVLEGRNSSNQLTQAWITNCLLYYGNSSGGTNQDGIRLISAVATIIANNIIVAEGGTTYGRDGIRLSGTCTRNIIQGNQIGLTRVGINATTANDTGNILQGNQFVSCTTNISEATAGSNPRENNYDVGTKIDSLTWPANAGLFGIGELSSDSNWGGYLRGRNGTIADIALADKDDNVCLRVKAGAPSIPAYTVATLPNVAYPNGIIMVTDESGGYTIAFSDGTNWRRAWDLAIVS